MAAYRVLKRDVMVAGDGQPPGSPLKCLPAGTPFTIIPDSELAQLHLDHFLIVASEDFEVPRGTPPDQAINKALRGGPPR